MSAPVLGVDGRDGFSRLCACCLKGLSWAGVRRSQGGLDLTPAPRHRRHVRRVRWAREPPRPAPRQRVRDAGHCVAWPSCPARRSRPGPREARAPAARTSARRPWRGRPPRPGRPGAPRRRGRPAACSSPHRAAGPCHGPALRGGPGPTAGSPPECGERHRQLARAGDRARPAGGGRRYGPVRPVGCHVRRREGPFWSREPQALTDAAQGDPAEAQPTLARPRGTALRERGIWLPPAPLAHHRQGCGGATRWAPTGRGPRRNAPVGRDIYRSSWRYASVLNFPDPADRSRHSRIALACFG
jgi:hypothetical protein